jgi:hypothetical protein
MARVDCTIPAGGPVVTFTTTEAPAIASASAASRVASASLTSTALPQRQKPAMLR